MGLISSGEVNVRLYYGTDSGRFLGVSSAPIAYFVRLELAICSEKKLAKNPKNNDIGVLVEKNLII